MNQPIPIDELRESIEEAQAREDIPGRAKFWKHLGGAAGGFAGGAAGGGAGIGLSRLAGGKGKLILPLAGAAIGGVGGATLGSRFGGEYGAEEARADKAIAMLRALRAHQAGAMSGFGAGMRRGYELGGQPAMETAPEPAEKAASIVKRLSRK